MEKDLRIRVESYMYDSLFSIGPDKKVSNIVIKFTDNISEFLSNKEYTISTIKTTSPLRYNYINYYDINQKKVQLDDHTNLIKILIRTVGMSLDFYHKKDFIKFKLLFYNGDT